LLVTSPRLLLVKFPSLRWLLVTTAMKMRAPMVEALTADLMEVVPTVVRMEATETMVATVQGVMGTVHLILVMVDLMAATLVMQALVMQALVMQVLVMQALVMLAQAMDELILVMLALGTEELILDTALDIRNFYNTIKSIPLQV
jgi:hypothetical protein